MAAAILVMLGSSADSGFSGSLLAPPPPPQALSTPQHAAAIKQLERTVKRGWWAWLADWWQVVAEYCIWG
ncbi:hypothetical protein [Roseateles oligotrophus]|uniref:hypothetical protein n=1 Tax=Roseateles oligotrophus TaxID=1769250 RepID=UPI0021E42E80|nr:hypothetical protein [Roseateles oligotrophus]